MLLFQDFVVRMINSKQILVHFILVLLNVKKKKLFMSVFCMLEEFILTYNSGAQFHCVVQLINMVKM